MKLQSSLDEAEFGSAAGRRRLVHESIAAGDCLLSERGAQLLGFVVLKRAHFFGRDFVELLIVLSNARRRGVGGALLRGAVAASTTPRVFTSTNASNIAMQALLAAEGWSSSGRLVGLDEDDPELVYYQARADK